MDGGRGVTIDPGDRQEILDLISTYAYSLDERDWDLYASIWSDDARLSGGSGESRSKQQILSTAQAAIARRDANPDARWARHHTTNTILSELGGNRVAGKTRWFVHLRRASEPRTFVGNSGHYHDEFVRSPEGWRFASRRIEFDPD